MDVPGLNEKSDIKDNENEESSAISNNFYFRQIFPLIKMNYKFSLFLFSSENFEKSNASQIIDKYLEGNNDNNNEKIEKPEPELNSE